MATQIVLLGTGTPRAEPDRAGSSIAIVVNDQPYIVDFGPGIGRRVSAAYEAGVVGLALPKLTRAFLTHMHSDHTVGYADLIFTAWTAGRDEPLVVYGPKGIQSMSDHILAAYELDIHKRLHSREQATLEGYKVVAHEILAPGLVYNDDNIRVEAFATQHGIWIEGKHGPYPALGFRFITPDRVIVISGDTCHFPGLVEHYKGCDVLIHEVYSANALRKRPPQWQQYHSQSHTSTYELAEMANIVQPELLILVHQLLWSVSEDELMTEIRSHYDGRVVYGRDLDVF